jgi:hypothetical protein
MNFNRFLYSLITLITALFFLLFGLFAMILPWSETLHMLAQQLIEEEVWPMTFFGAAFLLIGIALVGQILVSCRKQYYRVKTDTHTLEISEKIIQDYLSDYFNALFPQQEIPCRIAIKKNKIAVAADLPFYPLEDRKDLLKRVKLELGSIFKDYLGYSATLDLTLSFQRHESHR